MNKANPQGPGGWTRMIGHDHFGTLRSPALQPWRSTI